MSVEEEQLEAWDSIEDPVEIDSTDWQMVLDTLYEGEYVPRAGKEAKYKFLIGEDFVDEVNLSKAEINRALVYLEDAGLIGLVDGDHIYGLTGEGLRIAHERETTRNRRQQDREFRERQSSINLALLLATIVLAIAAILAEWPPDIITIEGWLWTDGIIWVGLGIGFLALFRLVFEYIRLERWP